MQRSIPKSKTPTSLIRADERRRGKQGVEVERSSGRWVVGGRKMEIGLIDLIVPSSASRHTHAVSLRVLDVFFSL